MTLYDFVREHTQDAKPGKNSVDMFFFHVKLPKEKTEEMINKFKELSTNWEGDFAEMDPFDGEEHSYIEVGAWIGDQHIALRYIALGELLGFWKVMQPNLLPI